MLTDTEIQTLLAERKPLRERDCTRLKSPKKLVNHSHRAVVRSTSESGKVFSVMASLGPGAKFSIHVRYHPSGRRKAVTLVRCNAPHGPHMNVIERTRMPPNVCHIHVLTERYQRAVPSRKALGYAEQTSAFRSFITAIDHVCSSYGFYFEDHAEHYPLLPEC